MSAETPAAAADDRMNLRRVNPVFRAFVSPIASCWLVYDMRTSQRSSCNIHGRKHCCRDKKAATSRTGSKKGENDPRCAQRKFRMFFNPAQWFTNQQFFANRQSKLPCVPAPFRLRILSGGIGKSSALKQSPSTIKSSNSSCAG